MTRHKEQKGMGKELSINEDEKLDSTKMRIPGFDYLRVFFMISVIAGHANLTVTWAANLEKTVGPVPNFWDYFYFNIQSIAVPTFILISNLLFCLKPVTVGRIKNRLKKLSYLYVFWVGVWVYYTKPEIEMNFLSIVQFILRGGGWLFYFIAVLILMTLQTGLIAMISKKWQSVAFALSFLVLFLTEYYLTRDYRWLMDYYYWLPSCFVLIPCFAVWLSPRISHLVTNQRARLRWVCVFIVLTALSALIEWQYAAPHELLDEYRRWIPKHARYSPHFGAVAAVIASLGIRSQLGVVMRFLARNSLGIYCLHGFIIGGFVKLSDAFIGSYCPGLVIPLGCVGVIIACGMAAEFLRSAFRHRLI